MSDDIHALSGAYAVHALDDVERARFERHLAGCSACQAEVASLAAAAVELSHTTETTPPAGLRAAVLRDIRAVRPLPPLPVRDAAPDAVPDAVPHELDGPAVVRPLGPRRRTFVAAAAAAVLAGGGFGVWRALDRTPEQTVADQVMAAADRTRVEQTFPGGARATVIRSASLHKAVIVTSAMPAAPAGKVYQLWLQDPTGHMASAGVMPPGSDQVVVLDGDASKASGAGITVEPTGGSAQPTGNPIALFSFV